jgi:hypothetical protein
MPNALRYAVAGVAVMPGPATSLAAYTARPVSAARPGAHRPAAATLSRHIQLFSPRLCSRALYLILRCLRPQYKVFVPQAAASEQAAGGGDADSGQFS